MIAAVMTTVEHLDRCPTCSRRTLHRRTVQVDADGQVVEDARTCVVCANRAAGGDPTNPVLLMKESRAMKRKQRAQPFRKRRS